jgi:hypothetical protein
LEDDQCEFAQMMNLQPRRISPRPNEKGILRVREPYGEVNSARRHRAEADILRLYHDPIRRKRIMVELLFAAA